MPTRWTIAALCMLPAAALAQQADPQAVLTKALASPTEADAAIAALRSTKDKQLVPLFEALAASGQERRRGLAISALAEIAGKDAAPALLDRLRKDASMLLRRLALAQLIDLDAISADELAEALKMPDPRIQCLAARSLVNKGQADLARQTLQDLTASRQADAAGLARLLLLSLDDAAQLQPLRELLASDKASDQLASVLMGILAEDRIAQAAPLAGELAASDRPAYVRVDACKALLAVQPQAAGQVVAMVKASDRTLLRAMLLETLAAARLSDAAEHFRALAGEEGLIGALAKLELARLNKGFEGADQAALAALAHGHPMAADYVLGAVRRDITTDKPAAGVYAPVLLDCINSVKPDAPRMGPEHVRAAQAVAMLVELASPQALAGLEKVFHGRPNALQRAVAAGIMRSNAIEQACKLARPLLKSADEEIRADAALTLARSGDKDAAAALEEIISPPNRPPAPLAAIAAWNLLKIQGKAAAAVPDLVKAVK